MRSARTRARRQVEFLTNTIVPEAILSPGDRGHAGPPRVIFLISVDGYSPHVDLRPQLEADRAAAKRPWTPGPYPEFEGRVRAADAFFRSVDEMLRAGRDLASVRAAIDDVQRWPCIAVAD